MSEHITFYDYVIDDMNSKEYDPSLPFGGVRQDAPAEIKEKFNEFVKEYNSDIDKIISEGESETTAKSLVKKYYDWRKKEITKKCSNSLEKHFKKNN